MKIRGHSHIQRTANNFTDPSGLTKPEGQDKNPILVIHAMTAAIDKAIQLHLWLMEEFPYLCPDVQTDSVPTIVEVDNEKKIIERSAIHITLQKK